MDWIASAAFGLEGLVRRDLVRLGAKDIRPLDTGGVQFEGDEALGYAANLWLRTADRVLLVVGRFDAFSFEDLYQGVFSIPWADYLPRDARFPVNSHNVRSTLMSPRDCQAVAKKAVARKLGEAYGQTWLSESGDAYEIEIGVRKDAVTVALNTSGEALSRRGYRTWTGEAPLRETLAAAVLLASPWSPRLALYDPMCGTGTFLIEGAFIALDRAPGLARAFDMEKWPLLSKESMRLVRAEADARFEAGRARKLEILGSDVDPEALKLAGRHIHQAGLEGRVRTEKRDVRDVPPDAGEGVIVANPPYGERIGDKRAAQAVARQLGLLHSRRPGWSLCAITGDRGFERAFGRAADARRRLYNGRLECEMLTYRARREGVSG